MPLTFSATVVIPTVDRTERLRRTLEALFAQHALPELVVVVSTHYADLVASRLPPTPEGTQMLLLPAERRGAAAQRQQGVANSRGEFILFLDDDVDLEPACIAELLKVMRMEPQLGACGASCTNQHYKSPGQGMRLIYRLAGCAGPHTLAGRCCGPALNFLPPFESENDAVTSRVDWLNLNCTLVRRAALPDPALLPFFQGYSLMEDAALTLEIGRQWKLAVAHGARFYHDQRPAAYSSAAFARERMEVVNRWFVMRCLMGQRGALWAARHILLQYFFLFLSLRTAAGWRRFPAAFAGKTAGVWTGLLHKSKWRAYASHHD